MKEAPVGTVENALEDLIHSAEGIAEIIHYIESTFPTYEQALGAMGQRDVEPPRAADTSQLRLRVEPVTTAEVK